jgi:hypothetical protein
MFNALAGHGGALSVYFGLSVGRQPLDVSCCNILLSENVFKRCIVNVSPLFGGDSYGGGVSIYMGAYASVLSSNGDANANVGETAVRNVSVTVRKARFTMCSARSASENNRGSLSAYGGSFSFYVGAYAWSWSGDAGSSSSCGATRAQNVRVTISSASCTDCSAVSNSNNIRGSSSYGGSISAVHIGAYAWSSSVGAGNSSSTCEATHANGVSVSISDAPCTNCSAVATGALQTQGGDSIGGSLSAVHIGAYAWSISFLQGTSGSTCDATIVSDVAVNVSDVPCINCMAITSSSVSVSFGIFSLGGSISAIYIGARAWSAATNGGSSSVCEVSSGSMLRVVVKNASCVNCSAVASSGIESRGGRSLGGSISAVHIGAFASSSSAGAGNSSSTCEATHANGVSVSISDAPCTNCSAVATVVGQPLGLGSIGGSLSAVHIGAYAWSISFLQGTSGSTCDATIVSDVAVNVSDVPCINCMAITSSPSGVRVSYEFFSLGGSISAIYIGARAWSAATNGGSSSVCEVSSGSMLRVVVKNASCVNCSAVASSGFQLWGGRSLGGSISAVYIGSDAWSSNFATGENSATCRATVASKFTVNISDAPCINCRAMTTISGLGFRALSVGGSISAIRIGAFAWGLSNDGASNSVCEASSGSMLRVIVKNALCVNCSAVSSGRQLQGAKSLGGSASAVYIGSDAWSRSNAAIGGTSNSTCGATIVNDVVVNISDVSCNTCRAMCSSAGISGGTFSSGGLISAFHIGGSAWSYSNPANSSSTCQATSASGVTAVISGAPCINCLAETSSATDAFGSYSFGGSISSVYIGSFAWSRSERAFGSLSTGGLTSASGFRISVSDAHCTNCSATFSSSRSEGANSYGGSISVYIGAFAHSFSDGALNIASSSYCDSIQVVGLSISIVDSTSNHTRAISGNFLLVCSICAALSLQ